MAGRPPRSFLDDIDGSPWSEGEPVYLSDEEGEKVDPVLRYTVRSVSVLKKRLQARIDALATEDAGELIDALMLEIRCQVAESGVIGHLSVAGDLHDLAIELLTAREYNRRR